ncbi:MAG: hypothetical protein WBW34_04165 [Nitrososphaeraceae archaeon]
MKLFRRDQNKENVERLIVIHYAKYIGVLSSNKSYPLEEGAYVKFYEDRVVIDLLNTVSYSAPSYLYDVADFVLVPYPLYTLSSFLAFSFILFY